MKLVLRILNLIRLAGYPLSYGITGALVGGALNRLMVAELGFSIAFVGLLFAMPQLVSPLRVWMGYRSDGFPLLGRRREPYMIIGTLLAAGAVVMAVTLAVHGAATNGLLSIAVLFAFALYGVGRNLAHNSYEALLAERFIGPARPRAMTLFEVVTIVGSVMGAGALGAALRNFDPTRLTTIALITMGVVFGLTLLAAPGQEVRHSAAVEQARALSFRQALRALVLADPQVRTFFLLILFAFIGTLAQDVLLEPYGALVLDMSPSETTRLTAYWGVGVLIAMLLSGTLFLRYLPFLTLLRIGLVVSAVVFGGVIWIGLQESATTFRYIVMVMGVGTGIAGAGMLTGLAHFTTTLRAGLLMGVWGMANLLGRAVGSIMGGSVVGLLQWLTGAPFWGYTTVFGLEVIMLLVALTLSFRLRIDESAARKEEQQLLQSTAA